MAKRSLCKCFAKALKKRPVLALRYRVSTALYSGTDAEAPTRVGAHKGTAKIDFVSLAATLVALRLAWKMLIKYFKKKRKKK